MSDYVFHPAAFADLDHLWESIAENNIDAADQVVAEIYQTIRDLVSFPQQGHRRPDLTSCPLRFTTVRSYLIAYAPDEVPLLVIAIIDGRRNPRTIATILRPRQ
jgi:plasmid stabilization system protein ParE